MPYAMLMLHLVLHIVLAVCDPPSSSVLLEFPVPVVQGADLSCLQPARDAVEVEGVLLKRKVLACPDGSNRARLTLQIPQATVHSSLVAEA